MNTYSLVLKHNAQIEQELGQQGDQSGSEVGLRVITITLPGTWFTVTYRKLPDIPDLVATNVVDDRRVALRKADFLIRASRIATNKARELGWIA